MSKTVLLHRKAFNQDVPSSILIFNMLDQLLTYEEMHWQKKWFLQNRIEDISCLIRLSTKRNSPSSITGNFLFKKSVVSLLVTAFKHITERLYASLPVTVIILIARVL